MPTSGNVSVGGYNIATRFNSARRLIGFCPQENVLFDDLTVEEHLQIYARMKGIPGKYLKRMVEQTIKELDLEPQRTK